MYWKNTFSKSYTDGSDIAALLHLNAEEEAEINKIAEQYPMLITPYYASLIDPDDPDRR